MRVPALVRLRNASSRHQMGRSGQMTRSHRQSDQRPPWSRALAALREAAGVTQDGWAAHLGYSRATVQRWERGDLAPAADAESAILRVCIERGLFRALTNLEL